MFRCVDTELCPLRRDEKFALQLALGLTARLAREQCLCRQLARADAGERAPGRHGVQHLHCRQIIALLQNAARMAHVGLFAQEALCRAAGLAVPGDLRRRRHIRVPGKEVRHRPVLALGERRGDKFARFRGKQLHLQLLDRIAFGMVEIELHAFSASRIHGLTCRSSSSVLSSMCPGRTRRLPGS